MKLKNIKKIAISIGAVAVPLSSIVAAVSCGDETRIKKVEYIHENKTDPVTHNWSFINEPTWVNYKGAWDGYILATNGNSVELNKEYWYDSNNFNIDPLLSIHTREGDYFHERLSKKGENDEDRVSEAYGAIFNYGVKSDILTPKKGLNYFDNIKNLKDADKFKYLSNITPHTLSEGGHINMDLLVKDGVVYNVPSTNMFSSNEKTTFNSFRAGIVMSKEGKPEIVANIPVNDPAFIKLKVISGQKNWDAKEKKNVSTFDDEFLDSNLTINEVQPVVKLPTTISGMAAGETRVISEFYESQKETLNLAGLKAYEVSATKANGITSNYEPFTGENIIFQAPYSSKITADVSGNASYKIPFGKSLIVHKDSTTDVMNLTVGDNVEVEYQLQENNQLAKKIKDSKWSISQIDYNGSRYYSHNKTNIAKFDEDTLIRNNFTTNGSWIMRNGDVRGIVDPTRTPNIYVPKAYFVMDRVNKKFGMIRFNLNPFSKSLHHSNYIWYIRSLGFTDILAIDGGGSSYGYKRTSSEYEYFPKSVDNIGYRVLSTSLAIGDIYE